MARNETENESKKPACDDLPDYRFRLLLAWWEDLTERQRSEIHMDAVLGVIVADALARGWLFIGEELPRIIGGGLR